jgi:hypothetical protein
VVSDREKVLSVRFGESAVAFGEIRRDRHRRAIQLVDEEVVVPRKLLRQAGDLIGEVDGFLVNLQVLEHERHAKRPEEESRTGEQETAGERRCHPSHLGGKDGLPLSPALLSTAHLLYFSPAGRKIGAAGLHYTALRGIPRYAASLRSHQDCFAIPAIKKAHPFG